MPTPYEKKYYLIPMNILVVIAWITFAVTVWAYARREVGPLLFVGALMFTTFMTWRTHQNWHLDDEEEL